MIGVIAKFVIRDGKTKEFERFFLDLARQVREREPDNEIYQLVRSRSEINTYKVIEIYRDQTALSAHRETDHYKAAGPVLMKLFAARPEIEYLDGVL